MPAANPFVIAVAAADAAGTESRADDTVADFSSRGNAARHADVLAAGRSVVSLRAPGSYIDDTFPGARVSDGSARTWSGRTWTVRTWNAAVWTGDPWSVRTWNARTWNARTWNARTWNARTWSARTWSAGVWDQ